MARYWVIFLLGACLLLAACEPVAIALLGAGASTAIRYNIDGVASRTFTAPAAAVKNASLAALERMGLRHDGTIPFDDGETIYAKAPNRDIEIDVEKLLDAALAKLAPAVPAAAVAAPAAAGGSKVGF